MSTWADESTALRAPHSEANLGRVRWFVMVHQPDAEPEVSELPAGFLFSIGRSPDNQLVTSDREVSRSHATLTVTGEQLLLTDLGSRHGVTVNGVPRPPSSESSLGDGDVVTISRVRLTVSCSTAASVAAPTVFPGAVVESPATRRVFEMAAKVARFNTSVVIQGETGTGKEVLASAIHSMSSRQTGPFVRLNCAAFPENLLEAELFGHEKGSFTGADKRRIGYLETASGGTLFLDEIGEMPLATQAKLLVVLESKKVMRVGSSTPIDIDVRYISATHKELPREVGAGRFREDLLYRLNSFVLHVPPLRERPEDLRPLCHMLLGAIAKASSAATPKLSPSAYELLKRYSWPGNVRELKNALEHAFVLNPAVIEPQHFPSSVQSGIAEAIRERPGQSLGSSANLRADLSVVEKQNVVAALEACGGNQTKAAVRLGISRRALIHKMNKFGLR